MGGGRPEEPNAEDGPDDFAGLHWEPAPRSVSFSEGWREWLTRSLSAHRVAVSVAVADIVAIVIAVTVISATLALGGPVGGVSVLLAPGILLVVAGQVWAVLVLQAKQPPRTGRRFLANSGRSRSISQDLISYFGPLDRRIARTVAVLCLIGFLSFITAFFSTKLGTPAGPGGGCAYRVVSHGVYTCVSKTAYDLAGGGAQRIGAGVFLFFYAIHLYVALASGKAIRAAGQAGTT